MSDKDLYQAELFANRLSKRFKILRKWARRERITCYRLYDRDIPEIPLAVDLYEFLPDNNMTPKEAARFLIQEYAAETENDRTAIGEKESRLCLVIFLYERPYEKPEQEERQWLEAIAAAAGSVTHIPAGRIIIKTRKHDKGGSQYAKDGQRAESGGMASLTGIIQERGQLFRVDLAGYIDTGLFFDHRPLRALIRNTSSGKSVLNLFCYTASFSVYAAQGGAKRIESVDLSNTYLAWAQENMKLNGFTDTKRYIFTHSDVMDFLNRKKAEGPNPDKKGVSDDSNRFDIIMLDPPTFSNSKMTEHTLDINRDWNTLINTCINLLTPGGILYFSTNSRRLVFDPELIQSKTASGCSVRTEDITALTFDEDYRNNKAHRCWKIQAAITETL